MASNIARRVVPALHREDAAAPESAHLSQREREVLELCARLSLQRDHGCVGRQSRHGEHLHSPRLRKTAHAFPGRSGGRIFLFSAAIAGVFHSCPGVTGQFTDTGFP